MDSVPLILGAAEDRVKNMTICDFKKRFGGQTVNYGRYNKIYSPAQLKIAKKGYQIYRKSL